MATLEQDIKKQSDWIIKAFQADGYRLDYSIKSFIEINKFFEKHSKNRKPVHYGRLTQNHGPIVFSIGSYIGETFIKMLMERYGSQMIMIHKARLQQRLNFQME